jgi:hypothetical protein
MALDVFDTPPESDAGEHAGRPYLCVLFECCQVYVRVYRRPDDPAYVVRCPKCLRTTHIRVGPQGSAQRFFIAG